MITIKSFEGEEFDAYMALPASGYGPGIVVLQRSLVSIVIFAALRTGMRRMDL